LIANFSRQENIRLYLCGLFQPLQLRRLPAFWYGDTTCLSVARSIYAGMIFSFLSFAVASVCVKVFNGLQRSSGVLLRLILRCCYGSWVYRTITIGGMTATVSCVDGRRYSRKDTYYRRALSLPAGRRHMMGYLGGLILVAKDVRGECIPKDGPFRFASSGSLVASSTFGFPQIYNG